MPENVEHSLVLQLDVRSKRLDSVSACMRREVMKEFCADSLALEVIGDRERNLCTFSRCSFIAAHGLNPGNVVECCHESDPVVEVEVDEVLELGLAEAAERSEEPKPP